MLCPKLSIQLKLHLVPHRAAGPELFKLLGDPGLDLLRKLIQKLCGAVAPFLVDISWYKSISCISFLLM
jgi:hypothetical protein